MIKLIVKTTAVAALLVGVATPLSAQQPVTNWAKPSGFVVQNGDCQARECVVTPYREYLVRANSGQRVAFTCNGTPAVQGPEKKITCKDEFDNVAEFVHDQQDRLIRVTHRR